VIILRRKFGEFKKLKIESKIFDRRTLLAIFKLMNKGIVKTIESTIKEGKESVILSAKDKKNGWVALKVYRTLHCDFKSMWKHLILDPRFKGLKKEKRSVVNNWCKREFKNLKIARKVKVSCPEPIIFKENVLVMSLIGGGGKPAPRLVDVVLDPKELDYVYNFILKEMKKLVRAKLIHTDLSAFNVLIFKVPILIDFSQGVMLEHPLAKDFLRRDIKNINSYFKKFGVKIKQDEKIFNDLIKLVD
jgi:RIO kinase 1